MKLLNLLLTVLLVVVVLGPVHAQPQFVEWANAYGGTGHDYGYSIVPTDDGGFIVAGQTASTNGDLTGRPTGRGTDAWVAKLDDTGAIQWHKWLGGTGNTTDALEAVRQTSDGGYIVGGYTNSENGDITDKRPSFGFDFWAVKLTANGDITWSKTYGSSTRDEAYDIRETFDGGYVMIGRTLGKADGDVSYVYSASKYDYWVVKLRADGSLEWEKTYGGAETDDPGAIRQTADSGYILVGYANSSDGVATVNKGGSDFWVIKIDKAGTLEWQKSFGGTGADIATDVVQAKDGGYVVVGNTNSQDGDINAFLHGNVEYWVLKLDDTGRLEWQRILGGTGNDYPRAIERVDDGYLISGYSASKDGDVTNGYHTSGNDAWIVKLDEAGTLLWEKSAGGTGNDMGHSVHPTPDGGCIVAGQTQSTDGNVWNHNGGIDMFIVKLMPVPVDSVVVTVQGGGAPDITTAGGTLQLEAVVYPAGLNQDVNWSIVPVTGAASIDATGLVTGQLNGTVWGKAVSVIDASMADSVLITLSGQVIPVDSVVVRTHNGVSAEINAPEGTLQLEATVFPSAVSQDVTWSIIPVTGGATINAAGLVTAAANGTVWAKAVSVADVSRMDSVMITISGQELNVPEVVSASQVLVYPNPTNGSVFVEAKDIQTSVQITLFDLCGRKMIQEPVESLRKPVSLDMKQLTPGVYLLHIKGEEVDIRQRIIRK